MVEQAIPSSLIAVGVRTGGIIASDVLKAVGPEWLLDYESKDTNEATRKELITYRMKFTPVHTSAPLGHRARLACGVRSRKRCVNVLERPLRKITKSRQRRENYLI